MKNFFVFPLLLLAAISCVKEPVGIQKVSFPELTGEEGKLDVKTIFNQEGIINMELAVPVTNEGAGEWKDYLDAFQVLQSKIIIPTSSVNAKYKARVYFGSIPDRNNANDTAENISIVVKPGDGVLADMNGIGGTDYDYSPYKGCGLLAVSDKGGVYVIDQFLEDDILGTMNGLVRWMNSYVEMRENASTDYNGGDEKPDAYKIFNQFNGGYTYSFKMDKKEVAAVACSDKDYLSGKGTVDVSFSITPLHAFDNQTGRGDYYLVNSNVAFNSAGMYSGNFTNMHGGVHVRICGAFARELGVKSFISAKGSTTPIGKFIAGGTPNPTTTVGSTTYSKGLTWHIGASLTGGTTEKQEGPEIGSQFSVNGGVQVNNTETRSISDVDIKLNQSGNNVAGYRYVFNNLPEYKLSVAISDPPRISVSTSSFEHSYIIYLDNVRDFSEELHQINIQIDKLDYGAYRFYTTGADGKDWTWGINEMSGKTYSIGNGSIAIPLPNRTPTGKLKITHDDSSAGNYIYEIKAVSVDNPKLVYEFKKSSYPKGDSFEKYLRTGNYNVTIKVGNSQSSLTELKSTRQVEITCGDEVRLNTGADFSK